MNACFPTSVRKFFRKRSRQDVYKVPNLSLTEESNTTISTSSYPVIYNSKAHSLESVNSIASAAINLTVSGSKDQKVVLYDFSVGAIQSEWSGHQAEVKQVLACHNEREGFYFSSSRDSHVLLWRNNLVHPVQKFCGHNLIVSSIDINPDQTILCSGSRDNWIKTWDIENGININENSISRNIVTHLKWGHKSNIIAQVSEDKELKIWDSQNLKILHTLPRKKQILTYCDLNNDDSLCLTSSTGFNNTGCELTLWDLRKNEIMQEFYGLSDCATCCAFLPEFITKPFKCIIGCSRAGNIIIWNYHTSETVITYHGIKSSINSLSITDEGLILVATENDGCHVLKVDLDLQNLIAIYIF